MIKIKNKVIKKIIIFSMALSFMGTLALPKVIKANEVSNSELKVSTDKHVVAVGEEVTMFIEPLQFKIDEDGLLGILFHVISDLYQEGAELQSIELPKTYSVDKNGKRQAITYTINTNSLSSPGYQVIFPVDSESKSKLVTIDDLEAEHSEGKTHYYRIAVNLMDEDGNYIINYDDYIQELYMEDSIKVKYKINNSGKSYKDSSYFYAYTFMEYQTRDFNYKESHDGKKVLYSTTEMSYEDKNDHIHLEEINSGKIHLDNKGEYKNTRLALRIISDDIEVVSDNFTKNEDIDGVYDSKIYDNLDNELFYTILPGEKLEFDFDYKLINKDLKAGDTAKYRLIYFQDGYSGALNEYEAELIVTDNYTVKYESEKYHEYLLADENNYKITDEILIDGVDELPINHDFIGWEIKETGMFVEEGSTVLIKDLIVDDNTITLNAVYEDQAYNEDLDKDEEDKIEDEDKVEDKIEDDIDEELTDDQDQIKDKDEQENLKDDKEEVNKNDVKTGVVVNNYLYLFIILASLSLVATLKNRKYN